jgi:two-component system sensor histidine kinase PilS (NtrC family)
MIEIKGNINADTQQPYIDISDNGPGINEETQAHIFEPFFTTSANGTGLGLYITKEVIESNRAKIQYKSSETGGTCFRIYFPQARSLIP